MFGTDYHVGRPNGRNRDSQYEIIVWFLPATLHRYRLRVIGLFFLTLTTSCCLPVTLSTVTCARTPVQSCRRRLAFTFCLYSSRVIYIVTGRVIFFTVWF